jgi:hypothetical protein
MTKVIVVVLISLSSLIGGAYLYASAGMESEDARPSSKIEELPPSTLRAFDILYDNGVVDRSITRLVVNPSGRMIFYHLRSAFFQLGLTMISSEDKILWLISNEYLGNSDQSIRGYNDASLRFSADGLLTLQVRNLLS